MPSSPKALLDAATKRADKLRAKGTDFDFAELLKMEPDRGTTNIHNTASKYWSRWFGVQNRCVVPLTKFDEPDVGSKVEGGRTPNAWFARDEDCSLMFFAGLWVPQWTFVHKVRDGLATLDLFAFLTTEPNRVVGETLEKAMPVILRKHDDIETWLTAPWEEARQLQRPLPDDELVRLD